VHPETIHFGQAIPIAAVGLGVNLASVWLLGAGGHRHGHGHSHIHGNDHDAEDHDHGDEEHLIATDAGGLVLIVFEDGVPPRFRLRGESLTFSPATVSLETTRPDGSRQHFAFEDRGDFLESVEEIPEPHAFTAKLTLSGTDHAVVFMEHEHGVHDRDNNKRAAVIHVVADAAVSVLVIIGLVLARTFGWLWMDPLAGMVGACVIASWSYGLIRDTGAILLDMNPDRKLTDQIRQTVEASGDAVADLHLWRLGPGHLGAILSVVAGGGRNEAYYRTRLARFPALSHITIEMGSGPSA
jgi:cation diffusion facilitator family transporter